MMTDDEARRRVDRWRRQFDAVASGHGHLREWERADAEAMVRACETVVSLRAERDALRSAAMEYRSAVAAERGARRYGTDAEIAAATDRYADASVTLRELLDAMETTKGDEGR